MKKSSTISGFGVAVLAALLLTGCTSVDRSAEPPADDAPPFTGPYSKELETAWKDSTSEFLHAALEDETISDSEWSELGTEMGDCTAEHGIEFQGFSNDGGYSTGPSDLSRKGQDEILDECEKSTGTYWIIGLRQSMTTNPENIPVEVIMTDCLVRNGAVDADYTKEQFLRDNPDLSFPFMGTPEEQVFWACTKDPSYSRGWQGKSEHPTTRPPFS